MKLFNRHDTDKVRRLGTYPSLAHLDRRRLGEIATWADEVVVPPGEAITGTGSPERWVYLVADPAGEVMVGSRSRPAGEVLGADQKEADRGIVAVDELTILAIPAQRRTTLALDVPALARPVGAVAHLAQASDDVPAPRPVAA